MHVRLPYTVVRIVADISIGIITLTWHTPARRPVCRLVGHILDTIAHWSH